MKKLLKKFHKIFISLSIVLFGFAFIVFCYSLKYISPEKLYYLTEQKVREAEEGYMPSLWLFNGIDIDEKGNIYIGGNYGVEVFDTEGKLVGEFSTRHVNSNQLAFKIKDNNLILISSLDLCTGASMGKSTYELKCDLSPIYNEDIVECFEYKMENVTIHSQKFSKYKNENGFDKTKTIEKNGKTYEYISYGKVRITDGNSEKVIELECDYTPIPTRFFAIPALIFLIIAIVLSIAIKIKEKKESQVDSSQL